MIYMQTELYNNVSVYKIQKICGKDRRGPVKYKFNLTQQTSMFLTKF